MKVATATVLVIASVAAAEETKAQGDNRSRATRWTMAWRSSGLITNATCRRHAALAMDFQTRPTQLLAGLGLAVATRLDTRLPKKRSMLNMPGPVAKMSR